MPLTTYLSSQEQNQPLPDERLVSALERVRRLSGDDWIVVPRTHWHYEGWWLPRNGKLLSRKLVKTYTYELYYGHPSGECECVFIPTVGNGRPVNWKDHDPSDTSVSGSIILAYLTGLSDAIEHDLPRIKSRVDSV